MKNNKILIIFSCWLFTSCYAQKKRDYNFIYNRTYYKNSKISKEFIYNSEKGTYSFFYDKNNSNLHYDKESPIIAEIKFNENEKQDIYNLYKSLNIKSRTECLNIENLFYKTEINFKTDKNKKNNCIEDEENKKNYHILQNKIYSLIISDPEYKKVFYWEFIGNNDY